MHRHRIFGHVVIDEIAEARIDHELLHQRRARAHGHRPDHLVAGRFGVENAACRECAGLAADADFAGQRVYADFAKVRTEGGLRVFLAQVAELDLVLDRRAARPGGVAQFHALARRFDPTVLEHGVGAVEAGRLIQFVAHLDAGGVDAGG